MLRFIALVDKVHHFSIDEYEGDVIQQLVKDRKLTSVKLDTGYHLIISDSTPYSDDNTNQDKSIDAVVFHLASENSDPKIENFVQVYRKNWYVRPLPDLTELLNEVE